MRRNVLNLTRISNIRFFWCIKCRKQNNYEKKDNLFKLQILTGNFILISIRLHDILRIDSKSFDCWSIYYLPVLEIATTNRAQVDILNRNWYWIRNEIVSWNCKFWKILHSINAIILTKNFHIGTVRFFFILALQNSKKPCLIRNR